ncbi:hypothetical protein O159_27320 [Leifsonia xyli subsp. cynodontis DSM 46306]|uniref:Uncharacterized protein n=1 Tax=Leifsonia xyli subsp. cynodontis DSM 46306 TaxID=1389489 RepID=U3P9V6_LEIXC|nr:hypothetical protein O159_27320 [Leifsonia xyli subsp. cynodontis DSM 46306]
MRAVLVPHHPGDRDLALDQRPAAVAGLGEFGVQPLESPLRDGGEVPHPRRTDEHDDVGRNDLLTEVRPLVAIALIEFDSGPDVVVHHPHSGAGHPVLRQGIEQLFGEQLTSSTPPGTV